MRHLPYKSTDNQSTNTSNQHRHFQAFTMMKMLQNLCFSTSQHLPWRRRLCSNTLTPKSTYLGWLFRQFNDMGKSCKKNAFSDLQ